jgi:DNA topoisomerase-1
VKTFDGHTRVLPPRGESEDQELPELSEGEQLRLVELVPSQHFTQPPGRYTEATLVRELEKLGIGRPSTYAPTISTLLQRNYVRRERRALCPTDLGMVVADLLVRHFPREMDVSFTSHMEEELDEVEDGKRDWRSTLAEFYKQFSRDLAKAKVEMQLDLSAEAPKDVTCKECGRPMVVKYSRRGDKFLGCSGFPECKSTMPLPRAGARQPEETEHKCDKCGAPMLRRVGRRGREYLACSAYPECRNVMGLDREGNPVKLKPRLSTGFTCPRCSEEMHLQGEGTVEEMTCARCRNRVPLLTVEEALARTELTALPGAPACDKCGGPMAIRRSKKGFFLGCTNYPNCKGTAPLSKDALPAPAPTHERCEQCGRPFVLRWGQFGRFLACSGFPRCRKTRQLGTLRKTCPAQGCTGRLIKKVGRDGQPCYGCTRFPACDYSEPVPSKA